MDSSQHTQAQADTTAPALQAPSPRQEEEQPAPPSDQTSSAPLESSPPRRAGPPTYSPRISHASHTAHEASTMASPRPQQQHGVQYFPQQHPGPYYPQASQPMPPMLHSNQHYAYLPGQYSQFGYPPHQQPQHPGIATGPQQLFPAQPYYYDPNGAPPPLTSSAATSPRMYPANYATFPTPGTITMTPQQGSSGTSGPTTPSRRSPRYATSNSINGVRLNSFVFPQQQQQQPQRQTQASLPAAPPSVQQQQNIEGSTYGSGLGSLPPKPKFQGAGGMNAVASSAAPLMGPSASASGAKLPSAEDKKTAPAAPAQGHPLIRDQLWQQLPPLPALPPLPQPPDCYTLHAETGSIANGAATKRADVKKSSQADADHVHEATGPVTDPRREEEATRDKQGEHKTGAESAQLKDYINLLLKTVDGYRLREEAMQLRVQALLFQPHESWSVISKEIAAMGAAEGDAHLDASVTDKDTGVPRSSEDTSEGVSNSSASVLGVRLLRKVAELQKENDELGELLSAKLNLDRDAAQPSQGRADAERRQEAAQSDEVEMLTADLHDSHHLLGELSAALKAAESRASRAEMALEVAVSSRSVGIMN